MHVRICVTAIIGLMATCAQAQWDGYQNAEQPRTARAYSNYREYFSGIRQSQGQGTLPGQIEGTVEGMPVGMVDTNEYRINRGYADYAHRYLDKYYWSPCGPSCCEPLPRHCCSPNCWTLWDKCVTLTDELLYGVLDPCCEKAPGCCHGCRRRSLGLLSFFKGRWGGKGCNRCGRRGGRHGCQSCGHGDYYVGSVEDLRPVPLPSTRLPEKLRDSVPPAPRATSPSAGHVNPQSARTRSVRQPVQLKGPRT